MDNSPKGREAFYQLVEEMANREVTEFARNQKMTAFDLKGQESRRQKIDNISWDLPLKTISANLPTLHRSLGGTLCNRENREEVMM